MSYLRIDQYVDKFLYDKGLGPKPKDVLTRHAQGDLIFAALERVRHAAYEQAALEKRRRINNIKGRILDVLQS